MLIKQTQPNKKRCDNVVVKCRTKASVISGINVERYFNFFDSPPTDLRNLSPFETLDVKVRVGFVARHLR